MITVMSFDTFIEQDMKHVSHYSNPSHMEEDVLL